ncbi:thiol reductant ABC exporter subunit CydC [Aureimonas mangrovi]|uniref:thiol reductant ABC exporter subunit CydC n=1 Tax=Aureimonas mangrovi TaxID=2758041 RepID=UPI00163DBA8C|nr:thiol reductant ABC exporter subunit CydC [Aureimonas mangrovi]
MNALLAFHPLFRRHARAFAATLALSLVTLAAGVTLLGVSGWFLTGAFLATALLSFNLFAPSAAVRGLSLLRVLSRYGEKLVGHDATLRILADIRAWLFGVLLPQGLRRGEGLRHGDLVSRLTADVDALDIVFITAIGPLATAVAVGFGVSLLLWFLLPAASFFYVLAFLGAAILVPLLLVLSTRRLGARIVAAAAALRIATLDGIEGHGDLRGLGAANVALERHAEAAATLSTLRRRMGTRASLAASAVQLLTGAALLGVLVPGIQAVQAGTLAGPVLAGLALAVIGSFETSALTVKSVAKLGAAIAAAKRLREIADTPSLVADPAAPVALASGGDLVLHDVSFRYRDGRPVLDGVTLAVASGERIAIQGPSGGGKSTLLALLLRLADPTAGSIAIAGADLRAVTQSELHRRIALLEQNAPVFMGTVRDNLLVARADATDAELWMVLEKSRLADTVRRLAAGLDTELGEAGRTLSAGEGRRLCLARTLLSPASILVLDEPASGLDRDTELAFLQDLAGACAGRTVILATHAELPAGVADRRFLMRNGRLSPAT